MALCVDTAPMNDSWNRDSQNAIETRPLDSGDLKFSHVKAKTTKNRAVKPSWRISSTCLRIGFGGFTDFDDDDDGDDDDDDLDDSHVMMVLIAGWIAIIQSVF
jgi:hypothetical protein